MRIFEERDYAEGMEKAAVPEAHRMFYVKWVVGYLRFCALRGLAEESDGSLALYLDEMVRRGRPVFQISQARVAVLLYFQGAVQASKALHMKAEAGMLTQQWQEVIREVEGEVRLRHYSPKTMKAYRHWIRAFAAACGSLPPGAVGVGQARAFLSGLSERGWRRPPRIRLLARSNSFSRTFGVTLCRDCPIHPGRCTGRCFPKS